MGRVRRPLQLPARRRSVRRARSPVFHSSAQTVHCSFVCLFLIKPRKGNKRSYKLRCRTSSRLSGGAPDQSEMEHSNKCRASQHPFFALLCSSRARLLAPQCRPRCPPRPPQPHRLSLPSRGAPGAARGAPSGPPCAHPAGRQRPLLRRAALRAEGGARAAAVGGGGKGAPARPGRLFVSARLAPELRGGPLWRLCAERTTRGRRAMLEKTVAGDWRGKRVSDLRCALEPVYAIGIRSRSAYTSCFVFNGGDACRCPGRALCLRLTRRCPSPPLCVCRWARPCGRGAFRGCSASRVGPGAPSAQNRALCWQLMADRC